MKNHITTIEGEEYLEKKDGLCITHKTATSDPIVTDMPISATNNSYLLHISEEPVTL